MSTALFKSQQASPARRRLAPQEEAALLAHDIGAAPDRLVGSDWRYVAALRATPAGTTSPTLAGASGSRFALLHVLPCARNALCENDSWKLPVS